MEVKATCNDRVGTVVSRLPDCDFSRNCFPTKEATVRVWAFAIAVEAWQLVLEHCPPTVSSMVGIGVPGAPLPV